MGQTWASLEPNSGQLAPTWAQLEHDWGLTWRNLGTFGRKLPPKRPNLAQLGPKLHYLGWVQVEHKLAPIGHVGLKLGPKHSRWTPNYVQSGAAWDPLATASHQVGPNADTTWEPVKTGVLRMSDRAGYALNFEAIWTSTWAEVAPKWVQVGAKLRYLGAKLGRSWSQVGPSWAEVGALLAEVDPKSGQCCGHVGSKRCIWTILGRSAKRANYPSPVHFLAPCPGERAPNLQLKLHRSDRSVGCFHSYPITPQHLRCI